MITSVKTYDITKKIFIFLFYLLDLDTDLNISSSIESRYYVSVITII